MEYIVLDLERNQSNTGKEDAVRSEEILSDGADRRSICSVPGARWI